MNFKKLDIKLSYISYGPENLAEAFLVPALKCAKEYKRSVGFFSSSALMTIIDGIVGLARNNGVIKLVASPQLSDEDKNAIELGYKNKREIIESAFSREFIREMEFFDDSRLDLLVQLISLGILDIKLAVTENYGIYHDKLGILEDGDGNQIVFYGSPNASETAYQYNYEKIRVVKSWDSGSKESIKDEVKEFDALWDGTNPYLSVYPSFNP